MEVPIAADKWRRYKFNWTMSALRSMDCYPQQIDKEEPSQLIQAGWALQRSLENLKYQKPDSSGFDYGI